MVSAGAAALAGTFAGVVGTDHVRDATGDDAIAGVEPRLVVAPGTVDEVAAAVREAKARNLAVTIRGAGTKQGWANPPSRADIVLDMHRLHAVLEHASGDLVASVQAGVTLEYLQQRLTEAGQWLAIAPPQPWGTVGGIIATNAWGPHRLRYGAMRDLLIGITYVLPDGTIAHAGGKVVKNVAGYDLCKLFTGSFGTLGVIAEAIVRLHPMPAARAAVSVERDSLDIAAAAQAVLNSPLVPVSMTFTGSESPRVMLVEFEGIEPAVEAQISQATVLLQQFGDTNRMKDVQHPVPPARDLDSNAGYADLLVHSTLTDLPSVLDLAGACTAQGVEVQVSGYASPTLTFVSMVGEEAGIAAAVANLRRRTAGRDVHVTVRDASRGVKHSVPAWDTPGDASELMRRVKLAFDPSGIMNPGRFVEGL